VNFTQEGGLSLSKWHFLEGDLYPCFSLVCRGALASFVVTQKKIIVARLGVIWWCYCIVAASLVNLLLLIQEKGRQEHTCKRWLTLYPVCQGLCLSWETTFLRLKTAEIYGSATKTDEILLCAQQLNLSACTLVLAEAIFFVNLFSS